MRDRPGRLEVVVGLADVDDHLSAVHRHLHPGKYVRLDFTDTGRGMDRATQARIFEPFYTTKKAGEGTGLGLSVVHGIMLTHDGLITVYSEPDLGTTFHLYFPVHAAERAADAAVLRPKIPVGHGKRIMYLDDEEVLAMLGQKTLEQLGYQVEKQTQVQEALARVRAQPENYDLIITDQTMPGMTGLDFAQEVHRVRPDLPIIITSGLSASLTQEQLYEAGITELLPKPHTMYTLGTTVHRALGIKA